MRKITFILLAFTLICSCVEKPAENVELAFLTELEAAEYDDAEVELSFTSPSAWTARSNGSWATVKNKAGEGSTEPQALKIGLQMNDGVEMRSAIIMVTNESGSVMFTLYQRAKNPTRVRLLYWNIQDGMWADQENNYEKFLAWIKSYDPDICVWNEGATLYKTGQYAGMGWRTGTFPDGWEAFAKKYGHQYVSMSYITPGKNDGYDHYPQVVTTRNAPITKMANFVGSTADTVITRRGAWQQVDIAGRKLNFITLHLWPHNYNPIKGQAAGTGAEYTAAYQKCELMYMFKRSILKDPKAKDGYWICLGDFNSRSRMDNWIYKYAEDDYRFTAHDYIAEATPLEDAVGNFFEAKFQSGELEKTSANFTKYVASAGSSRIDYVYVTPRLMKVVVDAKVPRDDFATDKITNITFSNGTLCSPSDHRPILIDFDLR